MQAISGVRSATIRVIRIHKNKKARPSPAVPNSPPKSNSKCIKDSVRPIYDSQFVEPASPYSANQADTADTDGSSDIAGYPHVCKAPRPAGRQTHGKTCNLDGYNLLSSCSSRAQLTSFRQPDRPELRHQPGLDHSLYSFLSFVTFLNNKKSGHAPARE